MKRYYLDLIPKTNQDHELHNEFCIYMPVIINAQYIGDFSEDKKALEETSKVTGSFRVLLSFFGVIKTITIYNI